MPFADLPPDRLSAFSPLALVALLVVLAVSVLMFWLLIRRATSHRQWVALADWGRQAGFTLGCYGEGGSLPPPFDTLPAAVKPLIRLCLTNGRMTLLQLQANESADLPAAAAAAPGPLIDEQRVSEVARVARLGALRSATAWNVLTRRIEAPWPPTALRPTSQGPSSLDTGGPDAMSSGGVVDLFSLASFPLLMRAERFVAYGTDSAYARALVQSSVDALLPPDVALLLHGRELVLDFSGRPFDDIEFDRMIALADSLSAHLPPPPSTAPQAHAAAAARR